MKRVCFLLQRDLNPNETDDGLGGMDADGMLLVPAPQIDMAQAFAPFDMDQIIQMQPFLNEVDAEVQNPVQDVQGIGEEEEEVAELGVQFLQPPEELQLVGDDNNNDQPDDVNNNTTDPQLQQIHQEQLRLQQEQRNQIIESLNEPEKGKKDKRKKKKKKKHRVFPVHVKTEPGTENYDNSEVEVLPDVEIE